MFFSKIFQNRILEVSVGIGTVVIVSIFTIKTFRKSRKKITRIIDTMDILNKPTVHIKNRDHVEEIVSQLIKGSASKLQVISDFDQTITRIHKDGKKCTSSTYGILDTSPLSDDEFKNKVAQLTNHYHPIEVDPTMSKSDKEPYMVEWYTKSIEMMPTAGITKDLIPQMVSLSEMCLRDGSDVLFQSLYKHNVPLLVFSAGIGDILKEVLKQCNLLYPNVKVIANLLRFDEEGQLAGFKGDFIHTFNKNKTSIQNRDYFEHLKLRSNVILLGDSLGDLDMAGGITDVNAMLKIGFLNFKIEENLPKYMQCYDIVLTDDQTMDVVNGLLQSIL